MASNSRSPFVDDLIPLILDASCHWWEQDYLRLAYVSSSWLFYVRKRLYACPRITSFAASNALARTLHENPQLQDLMSGIELEPVSTRRPADVLSPVEFASIHYLLGQEGLKRVKLGGELARSAERFLTSLAFPDHVEELIVDGARLECAEEASGATLEWDEDMLYRFPRLQKLHLANLELDIVPPSNPRSQVPINHLILANIDILDGFLCTMVSGVCLLDICAKSAAQYDEQVRLMLENCDVQELRYEVCSNQRAERSFLDGDVTQNLALRRLRLVGHPLDNGLLAEIVQRCRDLEELMVAGRCVSITVQEWQLFVASGAVSRLERLGLPGGSHLPPYVKWSPADLQALQDASEGRSIQLVD